MEREVLVRAPLFLVNQVFKPICYQVLIKPC